jgi:SAM-dependent methyltransferase
VKAVLITVMTRETLNDFELAQQIQSEQYRFPYHYLPIPGPRYRLTRVWNFAPSYLAALDLVRDWIQSQVGAQNSRQRWEHIDLGCGDGALIYHLAQYPEIASRVNLSGIDYDENAIAWAQMFNPSAALYTGDLGTLEPEVYDTASLIEVAEHIPPQKLPQFISKCGRLLRPNGRMVLTVPSVNKKLAAKHFQHFTFDTVQHLFGREFEILSAYGFERHTLLSRLLMRAVYRASVRIESDGVARYLVTTLRRRFSTMKGCGRLFVTLKKK